MMSHAEGQNPKAVQWNQQNGENPKSKVKKTSGSKQNRQQNPESEVDVDVDVQKMGQTERSGRENAGNAGNAGNTHSNLAQNN